MATQSLIKLDTENLFTEGAATLDPIATDTLTKIAEYIRLVDEEKVATPTPAADDGDTAFFKSIVEILI